MKKEYYKPKKLIIGLILFGFSILCIGMLIIIDVKNGIQNSQDILYTIGFVISLIAMIVGEGFILDAASYDINDVKKGRKRK